MEIMFGDWLTVIALLITITLYLHSRRAEIKLHRAAFVREYSKQLHESERLTRIFCDIDYGKFEFTREMLNTQVEMDLTNLLDVLNSLGFYCAQRVINLGDIADTTLGYAIVRVYNDPAVERYLRHIDQHDTFHYPSGVAFGHFRNLAQVLSRRLTVTRGGVEGRAEHQSS